MTLLDRLWYRKSPVSWLLWPFSLLFRLITSVRRMLFCCGVLKTEKFSVPVVIVGNISVGGNGKTPVVVYLVQRLTEMGYVVGVASRGYGGRAPGYPYLLDPSSSADMSGDEPLLIFRRLGCLVAVDPVRPRAVRLLEDKGADVIVSDDGLQHYAMDRDVELIVTDGARRFGNGRELPMGPLREGLWRLETADAVICNGGEPGAGEYRMTVAAGKPRRVADFATELSDKCLVAAIAGIGNPEKFFSLLEREGYSVAMRISLADHAAMTRDLLAEKLKDWQGVVMMTEKDAVKCSAFASDNWYYLPIDALIEPDLAQFVSDRISAVREAKKMR